MKYDIPKLEEEYGIKLDSAQLDVLSNLINFVESRDHTICLKAKAGTGKTTIFSMLYDILFRNNKSVVFVAPTNKAKLILNSKKNSNRNAVTIHSLLNLRPNLDIMEFDASQLSFDFGFVKSKNVPTYDVLLIDECSMINDDLYNILCSKFKNSKLIFSGDESQLAPINQKGISKTFSTKTLSLTKIYRQPESKLYKVLEYLRHKPLYSFKNVSDENGNIIVCDNIVEMIDKYGYLFKVGEDFEDLSFVKMITYTNNRIDALNKAIRKKLYPEESEYHIREILTGYNSCNYGTQARIENSKDYIITEIHPKIFTFRDIKLNAYQLGLSSSKNYFAYFTILSRDNPQNELDKLAEVCENLRQKAVSSKSSLDWKHFFQLYDSFLTPIDLTYDNRVIKRKSLDYGYCISAHKSQSSSYSIVLIDMENI